ncbi:MAG: efflux RND transporter permease subunit [Hoeflea sp.]|uniref:efflux RND transporter permease subunit n=1 Tax=Hoeflea sp. TaxID=1940281 RepID=UPI001D7203A1|nr:efflux RND transporter permease subunit [Hoeflea sp.]MBU4527871.1 efflux RND transporter permease subunit [Alphaproteobacteria bacterium]MBU4546094.1 efflux RND transporter permease subunit [Alphaproteobacteria bacterium]MBU4553221.1 efflux RND transporter permease subunit [Alphaproteobacteria bacterium]MBV1724293.1 efflux RND transporter permease subunit [Hoeflea sp.]MBV1759978.1 efflux RND transporter permease subunit [Hoeflea sp.]
MDERNSGELELGTGETGGPTALMVRRPVLAVVISLLIVVAGLAGLYGAEIRELPDVDRPVITVTTNFTGAAPETVDRELTAVVEGAVARVAGVASMSSTSTLGRSRVTVEFSDNTDLNVAASDVRDALGRVTNNLPGGADDPRIVKADANSDAVMRLAVTSDRYNVQEMTILVEDLVVDRLAAVTGVADVAVYGDREKIFRVDVDQSRLAAFGLTVADLRSALSNVALDVPAGSLTAQTSDIVVRATADVTTPEGFEKLYINDRVRFRDVASVTLGADPGDSALRANGRTGIGIGIIRQSASNTLEISQGVRAAAEAIQNSVLPEGVDIRVTSDDATFISGAIEEVRSTLILAVLIVIAIIFLFLRDWRATLIPAVTLPVALTGAFAAIWLAGFSVNILTLLALVLATGMVVDDAIVVLENIVRRRNQGMGVRAAAVIGTREVFFAVITTTATLAAVFIPISFLPGQAGGLFTEFGFVLAFTVMISSVVALTLCPMLASRLIKRRDMDKPVRKSKGLVAFGTYLAGKYQSVLHRALDAPLVVIVIALLAAGSALALLPTIPQELTPPEDRAVALMRITAPQGVSLEYTRARMIEIERLVSPLRETGEVTNIFAIAGAGGSSNSGFMVLSLAPWGERERSQADIVAELNAAVSQVPGLRAFAIQPNSLGIRGAGNGLQFAFVGNSYDELGDVAVQMVDLLEQDPRFRQIRLSYETTQPQISVQIDRARATDLGVNIDGLAEALQALLDGREVAQVFIEDRSFPVKLLSTTNPINDPTDLESIYLKAGDGRIVPMSTIATLTEKAVAPDLRREGQMRSVSITAGLAPGFALGAAWSEAVELAEPLMPGGVRIVPLAEAATLDQSSNDMLITFGIAIIVVLLVLAAQFESFVSALIIISTVPLGLACAIFAMALTGGSLNVYSQIGLVLLVGVMAKNGILIVEFANQLRNQGMDIRSAIEEASNIRLRPVMMTMVSTVLGSVPLLLAFGAGAEARIALGWVIVGGLGLAMIATLFLTPVAYLMLARFATPTVEEERRLDRELREAEAASRRAGQQELSPGE